MLDKTTAAPTKTIPEPLFIFELANNYMGEIEHDLSIVAEFGALAREPDFNFGLKLQCREFDAFIHPAFKDRTHIKYIKRFSEPRLDRDAPFVACASAQSRGGLWGLMPSMPSTGASDEESFPCSHPRCRAACCSP